MSKNINFLVSGTIMILLSTIILNRAINNGQFTCKNYISNVYLYISLAFTVLSFSSLMIDLYLVKDINNILSYKKYIFSAFILTFISMIGLFFTQNIFLSHILWLIFLLAIAVTFYPMYYRLKEKNTFIKTSVSVALVVLLLTFIAFLKPELISLSWGRALFIALLCGIIIQIVQLFFIPQNTKMSLIISYSFVLLFSLFLLYDTKILQIKAKNCQKIIKEFNIYPNYPKESLSIFLDILNLFTNIGNINLR